jgi:hypothetical protein
MIAGPGISFKQASGPASGPVETLSRLSLMALLAAAHTLVSSRVTGGKQPDFTRSSNQGAAVHGFDGVMTRIIEMQRF